MPRHLSHQLTRALRSRRSLLSIYLPLVLLTLTHSPTLKADDQASLNMGANWYGSTQGQSLSGLKGYYANFLSEAGKSAVRPGFSAQLEYATGTPTGGVATTLIAGQLSGGLAFFIFKTNQVKPFLGSHATLGWGNCTEGTTSTIGLTYGGFLTGGAEVWLGKGANSNSVRIGTSYRVVRTSLGSIKELDAFQLSVGIVF